MEGKRRITILLGWHLLRLTVCIKKIWPLRGSGQQKEGCSERVCLKGGNFEEELRCPVSSGEGVIRTSRHYASCLPLFLYLTLTRFDFCYKISSYIFTDSAFQWNQIIFSIRFLALLCALALHIARGVPASELALFKQSKGMRVGKIDCHEKCGIIFRHLLA